MAKKSPGSLKIILSFQPPVSSQSKHSRLQKKALPSWPFWCPSMVGLGGIGYLDKLISGACWPSRRPQCLTAN